MRVVAVDWSGRLERPARFIWSAIVENGSLVALEDGRDRDQVGDHLVRLAEATPELVVGLDFAFSLPLWFLDRHGLENGTSVPEALAERWIRECPPPFWGRPGRRRGTEPRHRLTELSVAPMAKSVFQVGGSGAVGTGSLRGFPLLRRLRAAGIAIWPFDAPRLPVAVEIFPRLLTGPVVKSRPAARAAYLRDRGLPAAAARSEDAFDAVVSAFAMDHHRDGLAALPALAGPAAREGWIWSPGPWPTF